MCTGSEVDTLNNGGSLYIWEVDFPLACFLVVCGLHYSEKLQLLREQNIPVAEFSPAKVHTVLARALHSKNFLSQAIDQALRRRLEPAAAPLKSMSEEALLQCYHKDDSVDSCLPWLWTVATSTHLSAESRRILTGLVPMVCCGGVGTILAAPCRRVAEILCKYRQQARTLRQLQQRIEHTCTETECATLRRENAELTDMLEEALDVQSALERRIAELTAELARLTSHTPRTELCPGIAEGCNTACPACNLCNMRVLIVGGVERMEPQYRTIVEGCGGILDYHDGKMRGGAKKLEKSLQRADIIICPVNCNSHGACLMVKNLAKKYHKAVHMLPNASISTVTRVFNEAYQSSSGSGAQHCSFG